MVTERVDDVRTATTQVATRVDGMVKEMEDKLRNREESLRATLEARVAEARSAWLQWTIVFVISVCGTAIWAVVKLQGDVVKTSTELQAVGSAAAELRTSVQRIDGTISGMDQELKKMRIEAEKNDTMRGTGTGARPPGRSPSGSK
jgi:hypothetical protein